jgi:hypothetical protein
VPPAPPSTTGGVSLIGATSDGASTSRASITLDRPAGAGVGDVLVATVATNYDASIRPVDPGWTVVRDDVLDSAVRQAVYVRVVGAGDPGSYRWTTPEGSRRIAGGITAYSGVDTAHPVDAVAGAPNSAGAAIMAPQVTTTVAGTMLVQAVSLRAEGTVTAPAGMTEVWEATSPNTTSGNTRDVLSASSQAVQDSAGPTGTRAATVSLPGAGIGVLLALRPA